MQIKKPQGDVIELVTYSLTYKIAKGQNSFKFERNCANRLICLLLSGLVIAE